MAPPLIVVTDI